MFLTHASGQTDKHTDTLIAIIRTPTAGRSNTYKVPLHEQWTVT